MNRFDKLLQYHLDRIASPEERMELYTLILSGEYDEAIDSRFISMIEDYTRKPASPEEQAILEKVYGKLKTAQEKPAARERSRLWWGSAAAVLIIAVVATVWIMVKNTSGTEVPATSDNFLAFSGRQFIRLPDGSTVLLNDSSKLSYREAKGGGQREVTLTGQAYFDVKPYPGKTFVVRSSNVTTTVLGTAFNIDARPNRKAVVVTVTRGKVQVSNKQRRFDVLTRDQQLAVNTVTNDFVKKTVSVKTALAWKDTFLIIDRVTLEEAAALIAKRYNVTITIADEEMKQCIVSSTFMNNEDLEDVLAIISTLVQGDFNIENGKVTLTGKGCR